MNIQALEDSFKKGDAWALEKHTIETVGKLTTLKNVVVNEIENEEDGIGYTYCGNTIYIALDHDYYNPAIKVKGSRESARQQLDKYLEDNFKTLSEKEYEETVDKLEYLLLKLQMRRGVAVHEFLHIILSDMSVISAYKKKFFHPREFGLFCQINNCLEDCYIEYYADMFFSKTWLLALKCMIRNCYALTQEIAPDMPTPEQLMIALIQMGDVGIIKGEFSEEAKLLFEEIAPLFWEGRKNTDPKIRAEKSFEITKLFLKYFQQEINMPSFSQLLSELSEGRNDINDNSNPSLSPEELKELQERKEEMEQKKKAKKNKSDKEENKEENAGEEKGTGEGNEEGQEKAKGENSEAGKDNNKGKNSEAGKSDNKGKDNENSQNKGEENSEDKESEGRVNAPKERTQSEYSTEINDIELEFSEEDINKIIDSVKDIMNIGMEEYRESNRRDYDYNADIPDLSEFYGDIGCDNIWVKNNLSVRPAYENYLARLGNSLRNFELDLKRKLVNDEYENVKKQSGKYDMKHTGRISARQFTRRREAQNKADLSVMILVDNSGSMNSDDKIKNACAMSCGLVDTLEKFGIQTYVLGFSYTSIPQMIHYKTWRDKGTDKYKVATMQPYACNFDGHAIRYATKVLERQRTRHKILIVISDGQPCFGLMRGDEGIADIYNAVRTANRKFSLIGVGLGNDYPSSLGQELYKDKFIFCPKPNTLFNQLADQIVKIIN